MPVTERLFSFSTEYACSHLQEQVGFFRTPLHLLSLGEVFSDDGVLNRLDKASADSVSLAIALAIVGDEYLIIII